MYLKRLGNGLLIAGSVAAIWKLSRIVSLSAYTKLGPFTNGASPGISANFLNGIESWLWNGVSKNGVPNFSWFGAYLVTTTPTFFNHNLHDANGTSIVPDAVFCQSNGTSISNWTIQADWATMTSTQVKLTSNNSTGGLSTYGLAVKF
jgi:hypothetical protein